MPMYNLIECSDNYCKTSGSLWQCYRDEPFLNANDAIVDFPADHNNSVSFRFKTKVAGITGNDGTKNVKIRVPLKYLSNVWRTPEMPLIEVGRSPSRKNCVICFIESPLKMMENAFYFILKALFVLKIFKILS